MDGVSSVKIRTLATLPAEVFGMRTAMPAGGAATAGAPTAQP